MRQAAARYVTRVEAQQLACAQTKTEAHVVIIPDIDGADQVCERILQRHLRAESAV